MKRAFFSEEYVQGHLLHASVPLHTPGFEAGELHLHHEGSHREERAETD